MKTASLLILTLAFALVLSGAASAGTPLAVNQTGTVSGDLYVNTTNPWSSTTLGAANEVTQANTLPTYTSIDSAMVYVNVYSGSGTNNWPVRTTIKLDGNGDGDYDDAGELLGVEDMNMPGTTDGTVYWLNDHCNRVYSDYQVWYDVKNLITNNNPTLYVKTETIGGDGYDGRIKLLALCVAYNDGDNDKVDYWVLNGQDWINSDTSPSTSTFNTSNIIGQVSSATLNTVALSGTDGTYTLNGNTKTGNITETGPYYKENSWDVTSDITPGQNSTLTYANVGSSLKVNLATLAIKESSVTAPEANFTVDTTSGTAPLTVHFTDTSTGTVTGWAWDFNNDGTIDSNVQNPTYTYNNRGTYSVNLTVTGPAGSNTLTRNNFIIIVPGVNTSLAGGTYSTAQTVTLTSDDPTATIYYTTDTSDPRTSETKITYYWSIGGCSYWRTIISERIIYTGPITINNTTTLRYAAVNSTGDWSPLYIQNYVIGTGGLADTAWPKLGRDLNNTGQSPYNGPTTNHNTWTYTTGGSVTSSPAIAADGTIYIGSTDGYLYAINHDGTLKWTYPTGNQIISSPTVGSDGTIYIGSTDGYLYAINPDGTPKWTYYIESRNYKFSPTVGADGTIYIGSNYNLYALNSDGTLKWAYNVGEAQIFGSPAIASDGTIYIANGWYGGGNLYALNSDGTLKWTYGTGTIIGSPAIASDGTIYVGNGWYWDAGGNLYAFNSDGTLKWSYGTESIRGSPAIGSDGTIYIGNGDYGAGGNLCALNSDGTLKWTYTTEANIESSPAIGSDGTLYIGCNDGKLYAFKDIVPVADFTTDNTTLYAGQTVQFTDTSTYPTSWAWDFNGDGIIDSTSQNPSWTYTTTGTYTVKLTVSNVAGSDDEVKTGYITVVVDTEFPVVSANSVTGTYSPPLQVTLSATDNLDPHPTIYYTTDGTDPTTSSTQYTGPISITSTATLMFIAVDGSGNKSPVQSENYTMLDTEAPKVTASQNWTTVTLSATDNTDPNPAIYYTTDGTDPTTSSTPYSGPFTIPCPAVTIVKFIAVDVRGNTSSVQSETYSTYYPTDLLTAYYVEGHVGVVVDNGGTGYGGGDPTYNLSLPADATILAAHLCLGWTWYDYPGFTVSFNGNSIASPTAHYEDGDDGQEIYDVTQYFNSTGTNTANIVNGGSGLGIYGRTLIVVYQSASEPYREIWVNEGENILYDIHSCRGDTLSTAFPGNAFFFNATNSQNTASAQVIITLQSGGNDAPDMLLNGQTFTINSTGGSDPSFKYYNVTPSTIQNGLNTLEVPYGGYMAMSNAILILTLHTTAPTVTANPAGGVLNIGQTVTLIATDDQDPNPKIYFTLNGDTPTTTSTLYTEPITINDNTTLKFFATDSTGNVSGVQQRIYTVEQTLAANFSGTPTSGTAPLQVQFTNQSTDATSYQWDFDNNGTTDSTDTNPIWTFNTAGTYTVKLTATNAGGSDDEVKTSYITVNEPVPVAQFVGVSTSGTSPLTVAFTDQSTNANSYAWDFNDDGTVDSTDQNPTWIYDRPGTYTVRLNVTGSGGIDEETKIDYITVNKSTQSDLLATEMKVNNSPYLNYSLVEVTITNIGLKTAGYFDVTLYDNGTQVKQQYALWLASDAFRTVSFIWSPSTMGEHHLEVVIDQNNSIEESNENNNQMGLLVDNRPDLTPTEIKATTLPFNYCYVTVDVTNNGEDLTDFYDVTLYDNGTQLGQQKIYGLKTGQTKTVTFLSKLTSSSTHNLQATTDATSTIPETDETNNTLTKQL